MKISTHSLFGLAALALLGMAKQALAVTCTITFHYSDDDTCTASVVCPKSVTAKNCTTVMGGVCQGWETHLSGSSYSCYASCSGNKSNAVDSGHDGSGYISLDKKCS